MAAPMFNDIAEIFNVERLTDIQRNVLEWLSEKRDVFLSLKTGGGKSLCYQAFPVVYRNLHQHEPSCRVVIVTPLVAIMREQTEYLQKLGFTASYIGKSTKDDEDIENKKVQFIFTSPESLLGVPKWRSMLLSSDDIRLLVVDEAHIVMNWGTSDVSGDNPFREWFGKLGEARSLVQCPMLVITATASLSTRKLLRKKLALVNFKEHIESPDRLNVKLFQVQVKANFPLSDIFYWLTSGLSTEKEKFPRHVIFCMSIKACGDLHTMMRMEISPQLYPHLQMFHSCTPESVKELIRKDMEKEDGHIRVLVATSAAGMGVNYRGVHDVVHFGPSVKMDSFVQELGRAGRDGQFSRHLLLYNNRQASSKSLDSDMKDYCQNKKTCRRDLLLKCYDTKVDDDRVKHLCCDVCEQSCTCNSDDCKSYEHNYFELQHSDSEGSTDNIFNFDTNSASDMDSD